MLSEIGSNFWLDPKEDYSEVRHIDLNKLGLYGSDNVLLSTGRSAIRYVLDDIGEKTNKIALLPPYTCDTVVIPFIQCGYEVVTYTVDRSLTTNYDNLKADIKRYNPYVVLFHRFFGFDTVIGCDSLIREYRSHGIIFVEDRTQNLFSTHIDIRSDYTVGSLRKWLGIPDGGYAVKREGHFSGKPIEYDANLTERKLQASFDKYRYIFQNEGSKENFLAEYKDAETILDEENCYYKISPISENIFVGTDLNTIKNKRVENYNILWNGLQGLDNIHPVFGKADIENIPLYFVAWIKNRNELQTVLRKNQIYAPIVWPKYDKMPEICDDAEDLYNHLLCFPIDQRYGREDMAKIVNVIHFT